MYRIRVRRLVALISATLLVFSAGCASRAGVSGTEEADSYFVRPAAPADIPHARPETSTSPVASLIGQGAPRSTIPDARSSVGFPVAALGAQASLAAGGLEAVFVEPPDGEGRVTVSAFYKNGLRVLTELRPAKAPFDFDRYLAAQYPVLVDGRAEIRRTYKRITFQQHQGIGTDSTLQPLAGGGTHVAPAQIFWQTPAGAPIGSQVLYHVAMPSGTIEGVLAWAARLTFE